MFFNIFLNANIHKQSKFIGNVPLVSKIWALNISHLLFSER